MNTGVCPLGLMSLRPLQRGDGTPSAPTRSVLSEYLPPFESELEMQMGATEQMQNTLQKTVLRMGISFYSYLKKKLTLSTFADVIFLFLLFLGRKSQKR